jgi:nucleotide-binding universal stress UspA family protein
VTVLVGRRQPTDAHDGPVIALGVRLARALGEPLVVCTVLPPGVSPARTDVPTEAAGVAVTDTSITDRSIPGGLARAARTHQATAIVIGDGPHRPGTVGTRLARAAGLPVVLADVGPQVDDTAPVTRVTCAFDGSRTAPDVLATAADLAGRAGATVRVASFSPHRPPVVPPEIGLDAENDVVDQWRAQMLASQHAAVASLGLDGNTTETLAVDAATVEEAVTGLGWNDGDLLVVGASAMGAATRVLLGDPSAAILRAAPVPVVLSPGDVGL